jgi:hypothetical protein
VDVKSGYGRNFLQRTGRTAPAAPENVKKFETGENVQKGAGAMECPMKDDKPAPHCQSSSRAQRLKKGRRFILRRGSASRPKNGQQPRPTVPAEDG